MMLATGPQGDAIRTLEQMVAMTLAFRNRRREFTAEEALGSVYYPSVNDPLQTKRPYAVITDDGFKKSVMPDGTFARNSGKLGLILIDDDELFDDHQRSEIDFKNFIEGVADELAERSATDGLLAISSIETEIGPAHSDEREVAAVGGAQNAYQWVKFGVEWRNFDT